jgi:hypothetical protein
VPFPLGIHPAALDVWRAHLQRAATRLPRRRLPFAHLRSAAVIAPASVVPYVLVDFRLFRLVQRLQRHKL